MRLSFFSNFISTTPFSFFFWFSSEDSVYNLNTESMMSPSPSSSSMETQGSSEGLKAEEMKCVNSNAI
jgi:hypothetical protein